MPAANWQDSDGLAVARLRRRGPVRDPVDDGPEIARIVARAADLLPSAPSEAYDDLSDHELRELAADHGGSGGRQVIRALDLAAGAHP